MASLFIHARASPSPAPAKAKAKAMARQGEARHARARGAFLFVALTHDDLVAKAKFPIRQERSARVLK